MNIQFTEVDFYKSMFNLQVRLTQIAKDNYPHLVDGKLAYPVDCQEGIQVESDIKSLQRALLILKQDNS